MSSARPAFVLAPLVLGGMTTLALGVYASVHEPTGRGLVFVDADRVGDVKMGLTVVAVVLVVAQLVLGTRLRSAVAVSGRAGGTSGRAGMLADVHRLLGTVAFAVSIPVAFHCVWAFGYRSDETVFLIHSLVGCLVYGLYVAKVVAGRLGESSRALVPALGAGLGAAFVIVAATAR